MLFFSLLKVQAHIMFRIVFAISLMTVVGSAPSPFYTRSSVRTPTSYVEQYLVVPDKNDAYRVPLTQVHHVNDFKFPKQQVFYHNPQAHSSLHNIHENSPMWQNLMEMMKQNSDKAEAAVKNDAMMQQPMKSDAMNSKISQRETTLMTEAIIKDGRDIPAALSDNPIIADDVNAEMIQREAKSMGEAEFMGGEKMIDSVDYGMTQETGMPEMAKMMEEKSMAELMNQQAMLEIMREKTYEEFMQMAMEAQRMQEESQAVPQLQQETIESQDQEKINLMEMMKTETVPLLSRVDADSEASQTQAIEMPKLMVNHENRMEVLNAMMQILQNANLMTEVRGEKSQDVMTPQVLTREEAKKDDTVEVVKSLELIQESIPEVIVKEDSITPEANQTEQKNENAEIINEEILKETEVLKENSDEVAENEVLRNDNQEAQKLITENLTISQMLELLEMMKSMLSTTQATPTTSESPQVITETPLVVTEEPQLITELPQLITEAPSTTAAPLILNEPLADPIVIDEMPQKSMTEIMQEILKINQASLNILEMMKMVENSISTTNITENNVDSITETPAKISELMSNMLNIESQPRINNEITEAVLMNNAAMQSNDDDSSSRDVKAMELEVVANSDAQGKSFEMRMVEVTTEGNNALTERITEQSESAANKSERPTELSTENTSSEFNDESNARNAEINLEDNNENGNDKKEEQENSEEQSVSTRQGRVNTSPTLFLHNNRFYVISGAPDFYANFDAYQKRTPVFSLQQLQPIRPIDKNERVQRVEPFRIYVEDENDKTRDDGDDNERESEPLKLNESQAHDIEKQSADGEVKKPEQASAGKGRTCFNSHKKIA